MEGFSYAGRWGPEALIDSAGNAVPDASALLTTTDGDTAALYTDKTKTTLAANPASTDSAGNLTLFTDPGDYVLVVTVDGTARPGIEITVPVDPAEIVGGIQASGLTAVEPTNPAAGQVWLSNRIQDIRPPFSLNDREIAFQATATGWEGGWVQEPQVWIHDDTWQMLYNGGSSGTSAIGYASCPTSADPTKTANWTRFAGNPVLGQGVGGEAGIAFHSGIFVSGDNVYCFYSNNTDIKVATATLADPTSWSVVGTVLTPPAGTIAPLANPCVIAYQGGFGMFYEARDSVTGALWKLGFATCATLTGTYASQQYPLVGLEINPAAGKSTFSGPCVILEDGVYVMWFHAAYGAFGISGVIPTEIYRATADSPLGPWTLHDGGVPILRTSTHPSEVDQVGDPWLVQTEDGQWYVFWEGVNNASARGHIMCAPCRPTTYRRDLDRWVPINGIQAPGSVLTRPYFGRAKRTTDFTTTTGSGTAVDVTSLIFTGLIAPYPARAHMYLQGQVKSSSAGTLTLQINISPTPYAGDTTTTCVFEDMAADTYRPFHVTAIADLSSSGNYTIKAQVVNAQGSSPTTTVKTGTKLEFDIRPI